MRSQIVTVHIRADQKPTQSDHPVQVSTANLDVPPDPSIPVLKLQGRRPEPHCTKPTMLRGDQIAKLPPNKGSRTPRMLADHHLVPDPHLFHSLHNDKLQSAHIPGLRRERPAALKPAPKDVSDSRDRVA